MAQLQKLKARWNDPAYVEEQARARLQYARPGDTVYVVVDPGRINTDASAGQSVPISASSGTSNWRVRGLDQPAGRRRRAVMVRPVAVGGHG